MNICILEVYESVGCYNDSNTDRALAILEDRHDSLTDRYWKRKDPIGTCFKVARSFEYSTFGVQQRGICVGSFLTNGGYDKYGEDKNCWHGGVGACLKNNVYHIKKGKRNYYKLCLELNDLF